MQTRALKTLVEIDRAGSFATAAHQLNMTLSAVSMQIKALEQDLGATLFDRSVRPPRFTPVGRTVCDQAKALLSAERNLRAACTPHDGLAGRYRIGFVPTASVRLLPAFLVGAQRLAGTAEFDVVTGLSDVLERQVRDGDLDFAVLTGSDTFVDGLGSHTLREEALAFAAPTTVPSKDPAKLIHRLPFLHFAPSSGIGKLISERMGNLVTTGRGVLVFDSVEAIIECVNRGVGFTLLPEPDIRRYQTKTTRMFSDRGPALSRRLDLIWSAARHPHPQAEQVRDLFAVPPS